MGSQYRKTFLSLLLAVLAFNANAVAQKAASFSQTFTLYNYYGRNCPGSGWCVPANWLKDGGFFLFNPNTTSLMVRATLTAVNKPRFVFSNGQTGVFDFPVLTLAGYADCVDHPGLVAQQMLGPFGVGTIDFDYSFVETTFRLDVWSTNGAPFYMYGPGNNFLVSETARAGGGAAAYYDAWRDFDRQIPVTWDSGIQGWVAPFANFWHNRSDWPEGWQTTVTITQPAYYFAATYTIRNIGQSGGHGHSGSIPSFGCCAAINPATESNEVCAGNQFGTMCTSQYLFSYTSLATVTRDAYRFHISEQAGEVTADHDGHLVVKVNTNNPNGVVVSVRVSPNAVGDGQFCQ